MCSETSPPRISFSHDLADGNESRPNNQHDEHRRQDLTLMDSDLDFEFIISNNIEHESSSADELFSNGTILPIKMREKLFSHTCEAPNAYTASLPPLPPTGFTENSKQVTSVNSDSKSFWGFKRSSSLNFDSKRVSLCPLPLLSRSNSTGSVPNPRPKKLKDSQKQNPQKHLSSSMGKSYSSSSSSLNQKPQLRKNSGGVYGNYHCISPVLNVPPPKFFGLSSLLRCGKDKKTKK